MLDGLERWLIDLGFTVVSAPWLAQATLLIGILLVGYLLRVLILWFIRRGLSKWIEKTETYWDDVFYRSNFFLRLSNLLPFY